MADDMLPLMRKIICANVIFWLYTVIHTIFAIIQFFIKDSKNFAYILFGLSIIQLLHSVLVTICTKTKKFDFYFACIIIQVAYLFIIFFLVICFHFVYSLLNIIFTPIFGEAESDIWYILSFLVVEIIPALFTFCFTHAFKRLAEIAIQENIQNMNDNRLMEN